MTQHSRVRPTALAATLLCLSLPASLRAQTAAAEPTASLEAVTITGTRIRTNDAISANVESIRAADIAKTGLTTTSDLLRSVPQVSNLGADDSRTSGSQRAVSNIFAGSAINLRGLGVEATLGLLDGKRPTRGGEGRFFDFNNIPAIALRQMEVVPDGASAIYGSDAVAGVVNLLPYHRYDGLLLRANGGHANGLNESTFSALGGKDWAGGGGVLALEHYKRGRLGAEARPELYNDSLSTAGTLGTSTNSSPGNLRVGGKVVPIIDSNGDGRLSSAELTADLANPTPNRQSNWRGVDALPSQKRDSLFGYVEHSVSDTLQLYAQGFASRRSFERFNAAPSSTLTVPASNYFNQTGAPATVLYSFLNDLGPTRVTGYERARQLTAGAKLEIGTDWQAEAYYTKGRTTSEQLSGQQLNNTALAAALADSTASALSPFGAGGFTSPTTLASINGSIQQHVVTALDNASVKAEGPLFNLPGGEVRLATGIEYLRETREAYTASTAAGANVNTPVIGTQAGVTRKVSSAYGELFIPLIGAKNAMTGVHRLQLTVAVRADDYKDEVPGNVLLSTRTTNPKLGLIWMPTDELKLRGGWGKSFRAPSLGDYSYGAPTFQAAASAAAVPHTPGLLGLPDGPVAAALIQGGRLDGVLKPETAKSFSVGMDLSPKQVRGLDLSLTYYHVDYMNQIQAPASTSAFTDPALATRLAAEGLAIANPTTAQLQQFLAFGGPLTPHIGPPTVVLYGSGSTPAGPQSIPVFLLIDARSVNSGEVRSSGLDLSVRYRFPTSIGTWTLADAATYVTSFKQSLLPGSPLVTQLNNYGYPLRFGNRASVGWDRDGVSANLYMNYGNAYNNTQVSPNTRIAANTTFDMSLGYAWGATSGAWLKDLSVQLSARNLFDRRPPYALVGNPAQTFDTQNASAIGRMVSVNLQKKI